MTPQPKEEQNTSREEWQERFDKKITEHKWVFQNPETIDATLKYVKDFIRAEIEAAEKRGEENVWRKMRDAMKDLSSN